MVRRTLSSSDPLVRLADSGAFGQYARCVLIQGADPSDPEGDRGSSKVIAVGKTNLAPAGNHSLALKLESVPYTFPNGEVADDGVPRIVVEGAHDASASDLLSSVEELSEKEAAKEFLRDYLFEGPREAREVEGEAKRQGFSTSTLHRAKKDVVRVEKERGRVDGRWFWTLKVHPQDDEHLEHLGSTTGSLVSTFEGAQGAQGARDVHLPTTASTTRGRARRCSCEGWTAQLGDGSCQRCGKEHRG
jgi:hypothetical protein